MAIMMNIERKMTSKDIVEVGLGSIGKIKIIKALAEEDKMSTVYTLHKKTRLKREDIKRNLDDLIKIGWVNESKLANIMYSINRENDYVNHLTEFFADVGYIDML
jgi:DNA-binding MarR family transcriptional regulator